MMSDTISNTEISYKLGAVESAMTHLSETVKTGLERLEKKIDVTNSQQAEKVRELAKKVEVNELKLEELEDWRDGLIVKLGFAASAISLFWVVFTEPIQHFFAGVF